MSKSLMLLALLILLAYAAILYVYYPSLPEQVVAHVSFNGKADRYFHKKNIIYLPLVHLVLVAGIIFFYTKPHIMNYGVPVTDKNRDRLYKGMQFFMAILCLVVSIVFACIAIGFYLIDDRGFYILLLLGLVVLYLVMAALATRKRSQ